MADALCESGTANETISPELSNSLFHTIYPHAVGLLVFGFPVISLIASELVRGLDWEDDRSCELLGFLPSPTWRGTLYLTIPIGKSQPMKPPHACGCKRFSVSVCHVHFHSRPHGALVSVSAFLIQRGGGQ